MSPASADSRRLGDVGSRGTSAPGTPSLLVCKDNITVRVEIRGILWWFMVKCESNNLIIVVLTVVCSI